MRIRRTSPIISHLLFIDDCYIFNQIRGKDEENTNNLLLFFCKASGQTINYKKSDIMFSNNTFSNLRSRITEYLNIKQIGCLREYLRLSSNIRKNKFNLFSYTEEKNI